MKISIGSKIIEGPYGGGNEFIKNLTFRLNQDGHKVINNLEDDDIDIIILINPLRDSELSTFNNFDINYYLAFKNPLAITVHRINECDERKNTNYVNNEIIQANKYIDSNIYVSSWLKNLYLDQGIANKESSLIKGGPNNKIFNLNGKKAWNKKEKLKIVTHHWSDNWMKGFDYYQKLDTLCSSKKWRDKIEFTYIGNIPKNLEFKNSNVLSPMSGDYLAEELKKHHIYITGSINEPSGNHHMEGAMCGLPILYINSGALPEYCSEYGLEFDENNLEQRISQIIDSYDIYFEKLNSYPFSFDYAYKSLLTHLENLISNKKEIYKRRKNLNKFKILFSYFVNHLIIYTYKKKNSIKKALGKIKKKLIRI